MQRGCVDLMSDCHSLTTEHVLHPSNTYQSYTWTSRFHPVCPTDAHISARKTASVTASRARQPSRLNSNGDYVTWFRAKNFSSQCLCNVPLLCCCSYYLWKLVWNKTTATVIPPYWDFSELFFFSVGKTFLHIIEKKLCFTHHGKCKT